MLFSMDLAATLHSTFGFASFRPNQQAVCEAAAIGRDVLLVMPTGAGKSLCYQLPAVARGGTALVISPLIALMDDQAAKLSALGLRVARIHSGLSREAAREACRDYLTGALQFLFIAPERMRVPGFPEMLARRKPSLVAIDEAHCISQWGHDFRPDYRTLGDHLPALRPAPIIALTATATPVVQRDIVAQLRLKDPALFIHGFRRTNLAIEVAEMAKPSRNAFVLNLLQSETARPAIVYAPSRKSAEELAALLNTSLGASPGSSGPALGPSQGSASGNRVHAYHAGLDPTTRERVQRRFLSGELTVVVATIAFGMGIDKPDVRTVIHLALPASVEGFYQEIGRAGRDGLPSRTLLLHSFADRRMHQFFLDRDYPPASELAQVAAALTPGLQSTETLVHRTRLAREVVDRAIGKLAAQGAASISIEGDVRATGQLHWRTAYEAQVAFRRQQIENMAAFAETPACRMVALIRHFGDTSDGLRPCGHCDICAPAETRASIVRDATPDEQSQLRSILRALEPNGRSAGKLFTDLSTSPALRGIDRQRFDDLLDALARAGLLTIANDTFTNPAGDAITYRKLTLTHEGRHPDPGDLPVTLRDTAAAGAPSPRKRSRRGDHPGALSTRPERSGVGRSAVPPVLTPAQQALADQLRAWRKAEAARTGKPAFIVLSDRTLTAIAADTPQNLTELGRVAGIGPDKSDRYGAALIALCRGDLALPAMSAPTVPAPTSTPSRAAISRPGHASSPCPPAPAPAQPSLLTPDQQLLEQRLREWRKTEAERLNLPQFFVLGASTLRSLVLLRPQTIAHLEAVSGIGPAKLEQFGSSLLEVLQP